MKNSLLKSFATCIPACIAVACILLLGSHVPPEKKEIAAGSACNSGYSMSNAALRQFMLDSLNGIQFQGGVYAKADLLFAINNLSPLDDSVHLLNILVNCEEANGTDLAVTTAHTANIKYVRARKLCKCNPPRPCCRNSACVPRVNYSCFNFQPYTGLLSNDMVNKHPSAEEDNLAVNGIQD